MSFVTNVILSFSLHEERVNGWDSDEYVVMDQINGWLMDQGHTAFGEDVDAMAGGEKHLETPLYVAAFNYFHLDEFYAMLRGLPWHAPQHVQVFVQDQDDEVFRVIEPCVRRANTTIVQH